MKEAKNGDVTHKSPLFKGLAVSPLSQVPLIPDNTSCYVISKKRGSLTPQSYESSSTTFPFSILLINVEEGYIPLTICPFRSRNITKRQRPINNSELSRHIENFIGTDDELQKFQDYVIITPPWVINFISSTRNVKECLVSGPSIRNRGYIISMQFIELNEIDTQYRSYNKTPSPPSLINTPVLSNHESFNQLILVTFLTCKLFDIISAIENGYDKTDWLNKIINKISFSVEPKTFFSAIQLKHKKDCLLLRIELIDRSQKPHVTNTICLNAESSYNTVFQVHCYYNTFLKRFLDTSSIPLYAERYRMDLEGFLKQGRCRSFRDLALKKIIEYTPMFCAKSAEWFVHKNAYGNIDPSAFVTEFVRYRYVEQEALVKSILAYDCCFSEHLQDASKARECFINRILTTTEKKQDVWNSQKDLYKNQLCDSNEILSSKGFLGSFAAATLPGIQLAQFLQMVVRPSVISILRHVTENICIHQSNNKSFAFKPYLIMLHFRQIEYLMKDEFNELITVLNCFLHELYAILTSWKQQLLCHKVPNTPSSALQIPTIVSPVLFSLNAFWNESFTAKPSPILLSFFELTNSLDKTLTAVSNGKDSSTSNISGLYSSGYLHNTWHREQYFKELKVLFHCMPPEVTEIIEKNELLDPFTPSTTTLNHYSPSNPSYTYRRNYIARGLLGSIIIDERLQKEPNISLLLKYLSLLPELEPCMLRLSETQQQQTSILNSDCSNLSEQRTTRLTLNKSQHKAAEELNFYVFYVATLSISSLQLRPRALLYGEALSGKSAIIQYLTDIYQHEISVTIVDLVTLYSPYLGQTEAKLRKIFQDYKTRLPHVLVLEGLEHIGCKLSLQAHQRQEEPVRNAIDFNVGSLSDVTYSETNNNTSMKRTDIMENGEDLMLLSPRHYDENNDHHLDDVSNSENSAPPDEFHRRFLVTLLLCLDSVDSGSDKELSTMGIIGVSRIHPIFLEQSLVRPGRFDHWISVPLSQSYA